MLRQMRLLLTFLLLLASGLSFGQDFTYPTIKKEAKRLNDFAPAGWMVLDSALGDLNKDGLVDAAVILQRRRNLVTDITHGTMVIHPRILLILFRNPSGNSFSVKEQSNSAIPGGSWEEPEEKDPDYDNHREPTSSMSVGIHKGVLRVNYEFFMPYSHETSSSYVFRYQQGQFALIGADKFSNFFQSSRYTDVSYNFLTKKVKTKEGSLGDDKSTIEWSTLKTTELKTLKTLKEPLDWGWEIAEEEHL
jgi:hypothetical protein